MGIGCIFEMLEGGYGEVLGRRWEWRCLILRLSDEWPWGVIRGIAVFLWFLFFFSLIAWCVVAKGCLLITIADSYMSIYGRYQSPSNLFLPHLPFSLFYKASDGEESPFPTIIYWHNSTLNIQSSLSMSLIHRYWYAQFHDPLASPLTHTQLYHWLECPFQQTQSPL